LSPHGVVIHGRWRFPRLVPSWRVGPILGRRRDRVTWQATAPSWGYSPLLARDRLPARPCRWWTAGAPRPCPSPPNATGACGRAAGGRSDCPNRRRLRGRVALGLPPALARCRRGPEGGPVRIGHRGERAALFVRGAGRRPRWRPGVLERVALSGDAGGAAGNAAGDAAGPVFGGLAVRVGHDSPAGPGWPRRRVVHGAKHSASSTTGRSVSQLQMTDFRQQAVVLLYAPDHGRAAMMLCNEDGLSPGRQQIPPARQEEELTIKAVRKCPLRSLRP